MQSYKVPVADVRVGASSSGVKNFAKGVAGFVTLFGMVGAAAWLYNKGKSRAGVGSGSGFSVEGDF